MRIAFPRSSIGSSSVELMLHRVSDARLVFVSSRHPGGEILRYYAGLGSCTAEDVLSRIAVLEVPERSPRSIADKLLADSDSLERLVELVGDRPAFIEPWNVTEAEVGVANLTGLPLNGTAPQLRHLGFKSEGRRVMREAGVAVPIGVEDVRSVDDVMEAIERIRALRPGVRQVIVKLDDSGAGDGNVVVDLLSPDHAHTLAQLPEWYLVDLAGGGIVEERIEGVEFRSPSAQLDVLPDGSVRVVSTHEQVLGGDNGQVYQGCRFPADPAYAVDLGRAAAAIGHVLGLRGAIGRAGVDFAAARDHDGRWSISALEINLRKGGTTHPYTVLRSLVPGNYDVDAGRWTCADGTARHYSATDNLVDPGWTGLEPQVAIDAVRDAGVEFDPTTGVGVVLHMLSGLAIDGRLGLVAIGRDDAHARKLHEVTRAATHRAATDVARRS